MAEKNVYYTNSANVSYDLCYERYDLTELKEYYYYYYY